jgi:hypothetical protein
VVPLLPKMQEFSMRSLVEVIDKIGEIESQAVSHLKAVRDSSLFGAPERQAVYWRQAAAILEANFPSRYDIANIFVNYGHKAQ